jgi:hypothetical protein
MLADKQKPNLFYQFENETIIIGEVLNTSTILLEFSYQIPNQTSILISDKYLAVNLYPKRDEILESDIDEYGFVINCNGSMSGNEIEFAKQSLLIMIHFLPIDSYFSIYKFFEVHSILTKFDSIQ